MAVKITLDRARKLVEVSRSNKVFTSGIVYNMPHFKAVECRFKAWDSLGWPIKEKE